MKTPKVFTSTILYLIMLMLHLLMLSQVLQIMGFNL